MLHDLVTAQCQVSPFRDQLSTYSGRRLATKPSWNPVAIDTGRPYAPQFRIIGVNSVAVIALRRINPRRLIQVVAGEIWSLMIEWSDKASGDAWRAGVNLRGRLGQSAPHLVERFDSVRSW